MKKAYLTVCANQQIADRVYQMVLKGELVQGFTVPGQFLHLKVSEAVTPLLRRPISIADVNLEKNEVTIIYRVDGEGTRLLSLKQKGDLVDVLGPLGNGFPVDEVQPGKTALLVGGGVGVPPLQELSKRLKEKGVKVIHVLGFQSAKDVFYEKNADSMAIRMWQQLTEATGKPGLSQMSSNKKVLNLTFSSAAGRHRC